MGPMRAACRFARELESKDELEKVEPGAGEPVWFACFDGHGARDRSRGAAGFVGE